jgi:SAM-dependent methyltransferase
MVSDLRYRNLGNPALLDLIDIPVGRALDCGCGAGDNARLLSARGWRVTGVTHDRAERDAAQAVCAAVALADLRDGLAFADDATYDLVVLSHILEHLAEPAALLAEARRVLAPGGRIAVALPNVLHYRQRATFLLGRFEYTPTGVMDETHLRFFTVTSARRLLLDAGYLPTAERADGGLPWWRLRGVAPPELVAGADRWFARQFPDLLAAQALFVARPLVVNPVPPARVPTTVPAVRPAAPSTPRWRAANGELPFIR